MNNCLLIQFFVASVFVMSTLVLRQLSPYLWREFSCFGIFLDRDVLCHVPWIGNCLWLVLYSRKLRFSGSGPPPSYPQVTKTRHQDMPVHRQCVLWADAPAVNRFKGPSSSEKGTQDHEVVIKIGKRADNQYEVSAIFTMRLENLCERGAWIDYRRVFRCQFEPVGL